MITVVLVVHLLLAVSLVCVVLLQKSDGGALGSIGGGGMAGFMTGRSTANLLTRTTAALAACFFVTSITLAVLAANQRAPHSVVDQPGPASPLAPSPASPVPAQPGSAPAPGGPSTPLAK
jgi:preprotein translocase subunit SecG